MRHSFCSCIWGQLDSSADRWSCSSICKQQVSTDKGWLEGPWLGLFISAPWGLTSSGRLAPTCSHDGGKVLGEKIKAFKAPGSPESKLEYDLKCILLAIARPKANPG